MYGIRALDMLKAYTWYTIREACLAHAFSHSDLVPEPKLEGLGTKPWLHDGEGSVRWAAGNGKFVACVSEMVIQQ